MSAKAIPKDSWSVRDAAELYSIQNWSNGYFSVSEEGEVCVNLQDHSSGTKRWVSLMEVLNGMKERGMQMPVLLRFGDLLTSRIAQLNEGFAKAIRETGYTGSYRGVYPIKVNQQQQALEEITNFGRKYHYGLEAGTKAELIAALGYLNDPEAYLVCNGYKDEEFIDLALQANKMGLRVVLVLEMPSEMDVILERAQKLGVDPVLGIRVRLSTPGSGHWCDSAGDRSVFGLNTSQLIDTVDKLKERGLLHCLRLLHYHQGSQVPNIRSIREAAGEACRIYVDLVKEGAPMGLLDLGGGLAVDYDGTQSSSASSSNYGIEEYCIDLIDVLKRVTDDAGVPNPDIITESGRAIVAYYSVLVFNILDVNRFAPDRLPDPPPADWPSILKDLYSVEEVLTDKNIQECFNDAIFYRDQIRSLFVHGSLNLRQRGYGEKIFWHVITRMSQMAKTMRHVPEELHELDQLGVDFYYGNFSLFQSLPDAWAIDQIFPVMPIQRLQQRPERRAVLADITCDCDGKIHQFIGQHEVHNALPVHDIKEGEEYYMGVFLVGAYQETLGDLHNLMGDTNVISVELDGDRVRYAREIAGDSVSDVLTYVEYDVKDLVQRFRAFAELAVAKGRITPKERHEIMNAYEDGLRGYTYFES